MKLHWPWRRNGRDARQQAEQSEQAAQRVQAEVVVPLRQLRAEISHMRLQDRLPGAISQDMHRKGGEWRG